MSFGSELKRIRNNLGLTVREVAKRSDISHSYLSQVENGRRNPPKPETLIKIAKGLNVNSDDLMYLAGYVLDVNFSAEKEKRILERLRNPVLKRNNLHDLLSSDNDLYYKDRLLTKEEKQKLLTIIETLLD